MKLWKDNRVANEWEMPDQDIVVRFLASKYNDTTAYPWPVDRALRIFISDNEPEGLQSVWDEGDPAYDRVLELVTAARRSARSAMEAQ